MKKYAVAIAEKILVTVIAAGILAAIKWAVKPWGMWIAGGTGVAIGFLATYRWYQKKFVRIGQRVEGSLLEFLKFAEEAQQHIFAVGPTLYFLASDPRAEELLDRKLAGKIKFKVRLLLSNPEATNVWQQIGFSESFANDVVKAKQIFADWSRKHENLSAKTTHLITTSLIFIDPDQKNGKLVIIPLPWRVAGAHRPCFMLSKEHHPVAFNTYYDAYRELFQSEFSKLIQSSKGGSGPVI